MAVLLPGGFESWAPLVALGKCPSEVPNCSSRLAVFEGIEANVYMMTPIPTMITPAEAIGFVLAAFLAVCFRPLFTEKAADVSEPMLADMVELNFLDCVYVFMVLE